MEILGFESRIEVTIVILENTTSSFDPRIFKGDRKAMKNLLNIPIVSAYYSMRKPGAIEKAHGTEDPVVVLDADNQVFSITGSSNPENTKEFFADIFIWMEIYSLCPLQNQMLVVELSGFNSSSSLYLLKLFEMWLSIDLGNDVLWIAEKSDETMINAGEEFQELIGERLHLKIKE